MANFSDYIKSDSVSKDNVKKNFDKVNARKEKIDNTEKLESKIQKYSNLSESELLSEFLNLTMKKKREGTLGDEELENLKATLTPYLDDNQKKNLQSIIDMVKNV